MILYVRIVLGNIRKCRHCIIENDISFVVVWSGSTLYKIQTVAVTLNNCKQPEANDGGPPAIPLTSLHFIGQRSDARKIRLYMDSKLPLQRFHVRHIHLRV